MDERTLQRQERAALCDTLEQLGPEAPTTCEGWNAIDLAAHVVVRERDPWTAPVIICGRLENVISRMTARERSTGFPAVVKRLRGGPPWLFRSTPQVVRLNLVEDWIHHEDVRRANGLPPRPSSWELDEVLWKGVGQAGKVAGLRIQGAGLDAVLPDGRRKTVKGGHPLVEAVGPAGELLLFVTGRTEVARVELRGPASAVERVRASPPRL